MSPLKRQSAADPEPISRFQFNIKMSSVVLRTLRSNVGRVLPQHKRSDVWSLHRQPSSLIHAAAINTNRAGRAAKCGQCRVVLMHLFYIFLYICLFFRACVFLAFNLPRAFFLTHPRSSRCPQQGSREPTAHPL